MKYYYICFSLEQREMRVNNIFHSILRLAAVLSVSIAFSSCDKNDPDLGIDGNEEGINYTPHGNRKAMNETRNVLLFYECGFNSLCYDLRDDMEKELTAGYIPKGGRHDNVLLVFSKLAANESYKDVPSYLRRIYTDNDGNIVSDTLKVFPSSTVATSGKTMNEVLSLVKSSFPAKGYSMVFSSHGSGWLPTGYYNNPSSFENSHKKSSRKLSSGRVLDVPQGSMEEDDPYARMVRSIGQDKISSGDVEMSVSEFAEGIPFKLDYLLFDMCFSGGIEVVYGLKDKADYLGISPTEVLAQGTFDYSTITNYLIKNSTPDLTGLYKKSFDYYDKQTGDYRSCTITLLRTEGLDKIAEVCGELITKYSNAIAHAPVSKIQIYYRQNRHYFFDFEDIFAKCGVPENEIAPLRDALENCIVYKAATPSFINSFKITNYSGLSMYLPCAGTALLDSYYKEEPWNKAVGLVK